MTHPIPALTVTNDGAAGFIYLRKGEIKEEVDFFFFLGCQKIGAFTDGKTKAKGGARERLEDLPVDLLSQ